MGSGRGLTSPTAAEWAQLEDRVRAIGPEVEPRTIALSAELARAWHEEGAPPGVREDRDLPYGEHPRQVLDVYRPVDRTPEGVMVFVHGGAFVGGDKHRVDTGFHDNVGRWAARTGRIGVLLNHRLAPQSTWPAAEDDLVAVIQWCRATFTTAGGEELPIQIVGTSSGAVHVATALVRERIRPSTVALLSGVYDLPAFGLPRLSPYFGDSAQALGQWRIAERLSALAIPMVFAVGQFDTPDAWDQYDRVLAAFRARHAARPRTVIARAANHFTLVHAIGSRFDTVGPVLSELAASECRRARAAAAPVSRSD